jgi:PTH1 family peptidyl-tRNA hydrolase
MECHVCASFYDFQLSGILLFMPYIIAGLGNPGEEYKETRHNAGRIMVEKIAKAYGFSEWKHDKKLNALTTKGEIDGEKVQLVNPETFMNKSGSALAPLVTSVKKAEKLIVIYDDLDLPLGTLRMSFNRGSGGHRGLESIVKSIKTPAFIRIRVGIAPVTPSGKTKKPTGEAVVEKHILGEFKKAEQDILKKEAKKIVDILPVLFKDGLSVAMSQFNA